MANIRLISIIPVLLFYLINLSEALYEDQIGTFDWKRSFIGKVKYASFEGKRIIVVTEENVLACLNAKTGNIIWRHILESREEQQIQHLHVESYVITVSGSLSSWYIRGWDLATGILLWEWASNSPKPTESEWLISGNKLYQLNPVVRSHVDVTVYQLENGKIYEKIKLAAPWISDLSACEISHTFYICLSSSDATGHLYFLDVSSKNSNVESKSISELIGLSSGTVQLINFSYTKPAVLILWNNIARLVVLEDSALKTVSQNLLSNAIGIENGNGYAVVQLDVNTDNKDKILKVISSDLSTGSLEYSVDIEYPRGLGAPYILAIQRAGDSYDLLLHSTDNVLSLVRLSEGRTLWTREEALSNIAAVEFVELPLSELDASIEKEFQTVSDDILGMFTRRLSMQAKQLHSWLLDSKLLSNSGLVRDEFGLHKIIVVATGVGKLFGIDTITGSIVWSYRLPNVEAFHSLDKQKMLLFIQRTARYAPLSAQCLLIAQDSHTKNGVLFEFDPITGLPLKDPIRLNYRIKQAMMLPHEIGDHVKPVIVLSEDDELFIYPSNAREVLHQNSKSVFLYTVDSDKALLKGYRLSVSPGGQIKPASIWQLNLSPSKIVCVSTRPATERLHSQGRVLPDRSVYYKYVNPNLVAVATLTEDPVHKHVLSVYLVDGVTGLVLYAASHKRANQPVHLVHSENWLVYSYFSERFRRTEIATAELYEGEVQSNGTAFSSFAVSQLPRVLSQSYILSAIPQHLTVTLTERGITNKFILAALSNGGVTEIPWMILQPRLPNIACGPEDGCIPYMPEVMLMPEAQINYNQSVERVRGIQVAPARLESTSHVLVYGMDMFYTRVAPSKTFDVLKEDFDHKLIVLVLTGLALASYLTKHLASRKTLRQAWK